MESWEGGIPVRKKIGFIGCGNIAKAMIAGIVEANYIPADQIYASNRSLRNLKEIKEKYDIHITRDNRQIANTCDIIFLTTTSDSYAPVIEEIKDCIKDDAIVILVAVGETIAKNEKRFDKPVKMVKAMPNTPAQVGEGITGVAVNSLITEEDKQEICTLFESFGKVEFVDESLMDIITAVGGSSPAFTYVFIEALADGAVMHGMSRKLAYTFAAQAVLGAAKMVLETGLHPGALKDSVCSPGGTTIESIARLEEKGLRSAVIDAIRVNMEKAKQIHG